MRNAKIEKFNVNGKQLYTENVIPDKITDLQGGENLSLIPLTITLDKTKWTNNTQTIEIEDITGTSQIWVSPTPTQSNIVKYVNSGILATEQGNGILTFTTAYIPTDDIYANVIISNAPIKDIIQQNGNLIINYVEEDITQEGNVLTIGGIE